MGFSVPQPHPTELRQGADENKAFLGDPTPGLGQSMQDVGRPLGLTLGKTDSLWSRKGAEELWEVWHIQKGWYLEPRAVQSDPYGFDDQGSSPQI